MCGIQAFLRPAAGRALLFVQDSLYGLRPCFVFRPRGRGCASTCRACTKAEHAVTGSRTLAFARISRKFDYTLCRAAGRRSW